ncbi:malonic semialdehyde reductase [Chelatococcus asaccharovorans]|uniref:Putative NADH dehydrogenase/NAD(P)H nitroreductase C7450_11243 n=1 Tax=Chelatococcus asaccharovorans TaxID=28210 RepID=A0A2V3TXU5_9HYPH|nr:malonic semialdehyde reductase [Chelatococcus asaccharovorans]MBS7706840.1 malonic semialdehyde reductase [Chelatococcus asaccharovorans]PXW54014.1 3-hydroxypropanoate dehydrogenase [Chelatococcus asaccharovorans]CAH1654605.1 putative malonic semialdehyde reductase [Chelatococcus asaccharovorans]CAH1690851.1 putative malonic semialdehyde reductase [Chelatococcus asaccharovorans]
MSRLNDDALDQLFREARTANKWQDKPVGEDVLHALYDLLKFGPTSANCCPARFLFVHTPEGKKRLSPAMSAGNRDKTMAAPVNVVVAYDPHFADELPFLFPHQDARPWFAAPEVAYQTAFRNGSLQGAYLIMAARSLGLDCGPMSGFDAAKIEAEFFADTGWKANFMVNLGYADPSGTMERLPRLPFDKACAMV